MNLYLLLFVISLLCLGLQFEPMHSLSVWDRSAIIDGQWWRILTGNFTHTNYTHLGMNLAGLWIISSIFSPSSKSLLLTLAVCSIAVGIGNFASDMTLYVGLSGALHGLFAYGALKEALHGRQSSWLLVAGLVGKILWEQFVGASETTSAMIGARVAIESHLAGAISGLLLGYGESIVRRQSADKKNA